VPELLTVNVLPEALALPAAPTVLMSRNAHGAGSATAHPYLANGNHSFSVALHAR